MGRTALALSVCTVLAIVSLSSGCARKLSNPATDPYEHFNRVVFAFNQDIDHLIYRPVTKVYKTLLPSPVQTGIRNVFDNISELTTLPNDLLQGKINYVFLDFWRFVINSTFGIGGLFDIATRVGLKKHHNDFGMTLAYWSGNKKSTYLQIPFLGPATFRDALGLGFDYVMSPYPYLRPTGWNYYSQGTRFISTRAYLMQTDKLLDQAFDPYIFVRNAYLQHRSATIRANKHTKTIGRAVK